MVSSYNVNVDEYVKEVGYRLEVVALLVGKMGRDKEKYQYDDFLTQSTFNQVDFLKGKSLGDEIPVSEYSDAVNLYHDTLESILVDLESDKKQLKCISIDKYQHIKLLLDSLVGGIKHKSVSDVPHLLRYMYDVVNKKPKDNYFKNL
ncbi:MAG: hypothetical protein K0B07_05565 [DPANN group archaeon]|nr:hypothetical protein [DPANN group archaeon]